MDTMYNNATPPMNINNNYAQPANKYIFELYIYDINNNEKYIKKIESKSHSKLIKFSDKIKFNEMTNF